MHVVGELEMSYFELICYVRNKKVKLFSLWENPSAKCLDNFVLQPNSITLPLLCFYIIYTPAKKLILNLDDLEIIVCLFTIRQSFKFLFLLSEVEPKFIIYSGRLKKKITTIAPLNPEKLFKVSYFFQH